MGCTEKLIESGKVIYRDCRTGKETESSPAMAVGRGPGTELKAILKNWFGVEAKLGCKCNARARQMDARGCDWCEANIDEIVGWLREEAAKRRLPFIDVAGRMLVRRAIRNARRAAS